jgi:peroxiredoxin
MNNNRRVLLLLAAAAILFISSSCDRGSSPWRTGKKAAMGEPAPDFVLESIGGDNIRLSDFRGKVVLLNFWATWCPPCRAEMPSLESLKKEMTGRDFVILAVSIDEVETAMLKNYVDGNGYTFTVLHDTDQTVAGVYLVMGIPTTYVIDKDGKIVDESVGMEYWDSPDRIKQLTLLAE